MIKEYIRKSLIDFYTEKYSKKNRVCRSLSDINIEVNDMLEQLFTFGTLPKVGRLAPISSSEISEIYEKLSYITRSLSVCSNQLKNDYIKKIKEYMVSSSKIRNNFILINDRASALLEYNCKQILNNKSNQDDNSDCSNIGKFTVLPYFRSVASLYNDTVGVTYYNPDNLIFTNADDVLSLPLNDIMAFKINSVNDYITLNVGLSINPTTSNMIYVKLTNTVQNISITIKKDGVPLNTFSYKSNEILLNFDPVEIDKIELNVTVSNLNKDKPSAIQIEDIQIFSNMIFRGNGIFESVPFKMDNISQIDSIRMYHSNSNTSADTNSAQLISLTSNIQDLSFNRIENDPIDVSLYKYNNKYEITNTTLEVVHDKAFASLSYSTSDIKWDADMKHARILYGVNDNYLASSASIDRRFGVWSLKGNYYYTYILNYEDGVYVNIGNKVCTINNKEMTGNILIPIGISKIGVHIKDINLELKNVLDEPGSILSKADIQEDTLYPYNLVYMFAGLPEYGDDGLAEKKVVGPYDTKVNMSISLNESFIPFTEVVIDDSNRIYSLQLTKATSVQGTYTIEPYSGRIKIVPYDSANFITITYQKAQYNRKPCGILFNRLLTFAPLEVALTNDNAEFFTIDGDETTRSILMPTTTPAMQKSQLLFNTTDQAIYASTRLELVSTNKYLTPIVSDIYLQTR